MPKKDTQAESNSVATNVLISPYPLSLSFVAVISAFLGVLVRIISDSNSSTLMKVWDNIQSGQFIVSLILALVFFNIYEYTSVGKEMGISVSWRSALFIGAMTGIAQDRILSALKALIGIQ